jgi:hypothetical protein
MEAMEIVAVAAMAGTSLRVTPGVVMASQPTAVPLIIT